MGFSGGGGSSGVSAHVHSSASDQGGALDDDTLLNTETLFDSILVYG
jgi:hypothetical protein